MRSDQVLKAADQIRAGIESIQDKQVAAQLQPRGLQVGVSYAYDVQNLNAVLEDVSQLGTGFLLTLLQVVRTLFR